MLILQNISYTHSNKDLLFSNININIGPHQKVALIGNNGTGKSTLLQVMAGKLPVSEGLINTSSEPYYMPQVFGQFNELTIAEALNVHDKIKAVQDILAGNVSETNLTILNDDWNIEERCKEAMAYWKLGDIPLSQKMNTLSGGQKTKVFLSGIIIHEPEIILLDEPSNHLDTEARELLYNFIRSTGSTVIVVSHDRTLLNILDTVYELSKHGIRLYGGNYDFYTEQKAIENQALGHDIKSREKALRKARETERETIERQQKLDVRGKAKQEKANVPTIMMNKLRNGAENSTTRIKAVHTEKINTISDELDQLRKELPGTDKMKFGFDDTSLHKGKILINAAAINYAYDTQPLWAEPLNFQVCSGERIALKGPNGSGKTTLIKIILGQLEPVTGVVYRADSKVVYIDQEYSLISNELSVYEQAVQFNNAALQEHEIKIRLNRFLFTRDHWDKRCSTLSGGEKMRLIICCLTISNHAPDMLILDEPTNNLDIQNIEILTAAINEYNGTLMVVSHDQYFLREVRIEKDILLS